MVNKINMKQVVLDALIPFSVGVVLAVIVALAVANTPVFKGRINNFKPVSSPIYYGEHSHENIEAKRSFASFMKNKMPTNKGYVVDTCKNIAGGYVDYDFNYKPACRFLGVEID